MTGLDIEAIRRRYERRHRGMVPAEDMALLLAEVERLTVEARDAQFEVVELRGELAKSGAEVERLKRLRGWNDELKAERDDLAQRCLQHEAEMREAGVELRDAQAALADALQVIADLRGETP